jgi:hypothetical protein
MYASDYDDTLPRHDNNGSCLYGQSPCDTPDWGDFRFPTTPGMNTAKGGREVMYFGAIEPYHKNTQISICPKLTNTLWQVAFQNAGSLGITGPTGGFVANDIPYYYNTMGQMAINLLIVDYGPQLSSTNGRPGNPRGVFTRIARPADTIMFVAESSWDWHFGIETNLGNGSTWPSWPLNTSCWSYDVEGWTRYPHKGGSGAWPEYDPNRALANPNMKGFAVFAFCDGHSKAMKFAQAERCDPTPVGQTWNRGVGGTIPMAYYYPYWVPDL